MKLLNVLMLVMCPLSTMCHFNKTDYRKMPPLYILDDYDICLERLQPSSYCLVIAEIVPNTTSTLWNQIANFSAVSKRHFRHDYLHFGVCLNPCKQLVHDLSSFHKNQLYAGKIRNTELIEFFTDINKRESDNRILNEKVINTCINYKFEKQYGLQVRSFTEYCVSNDDPSNFDYLEIIFMTLIGTLFFLVVLSSNYDRHLRNKLNMKGHEFYQNRLHTQQDTLLTSFSIYRNYYRLIKPVGGDIARDLRFLEAFRFFATLLVVFSHVLLVLKGTPTYNTEFIEETFYKLGSNIIINGSVIIQTFLVMSSFLLCINFQKSMASQKPGVAEWVKLILYRYLRLTPSLGFMILLNASILPRLQDGPIWRHVSEAENVLCRETWWRNLLFINNFTLRKSCLHQTWYLATDFQLYIILAAVLIFIARFPKTRNYILGAGVVLSFLSTGLVTYFLGLDAVHQETPESYRYFFWTNGKTIYQGYTPFYMNFGGFVFGTITALIYLKYKNKGLNLKGQKFKLNLIILLSLPLPFLLLLSGEIFYRFEFTKPSIWIGIYAGLFRNIWALMCSSLLLLMSFKIGFLLYKFSSLKMFVPLGRLSFQVYLIHTVVIRVLAGCARQPVYSNSLLLTMYIVASVVISFVIAFILYLFVELPLTNLINATIKGNRKPSTKVTDPKQLSEKNKEETTTT